MINPVGGTPHIPPPPRPVERPNKLQAVVDSSFSSLKGAATGCGPCSGGGCSGCVSKSLADLGSLMSLKPEESTRLNEMIARYQASQNEGPGHLGKKDLTTIKGLTLEDIRQIVSQLKKEFPHLTDKLDRISKSIDLRIDLRDAKSAQNFSDVFLRASKLGDEGLLKTVQVAFAERLIADVEAFPMQGRLDRLNVLIEAMPNSIVKETLKMYQDAVRTAPILMDPSLSVSQKLEALSQFDFSSSHGKLLAAQAKETLSFVNSTLTLLSQTFSPAELSLLKEGLLTNDASHFMKQGALTGVLDRFAEKVLVHDAVLSNPSLSSDVGILFSSAFDKSVALDPKLTHIHQEATQRVEQNNFNARVSTDQSSFPPVTQESMAHFLTVYHEVMSTPSPASVSFEGVASLSSSSPPSSSSSVTSLSASDPSGAVKSTSSSTIGGGSSISDSIGPVRPVSSGGDSPVSLKSGEGALTAPILIQLSPETAPLVTSPSDFYSTIRVSVQEGVNLVKTHPKSSQVESVSHSASDMVVSVSKQAPALQAVGIQAVVSSLATSMPDALPRFISAIGEKVPQSLPMVLASLVEVSPMLPSSVVAELPVVVSLGQAVSVSSGSNGLPSVVSSLPRSIGEVVAPLISRGSPTGTTQISPMESPSLMTGVLAASIRLSHATVGPQLAINIPLNSSVVSQVLLPFSQRAIQFPVSVQSGMGKVLGTASTQFAAVRDIQRVVQRLSILSNHFETVSLPASFKPVVGQLMTLLASGTSGNPAHLPKLLAQSLSSLGNIMESVSQLQKFPVLQQLIQGVLTQIGSLKLPISHISTLLSGLSQLSQLTVQLSQSSPLLLSGLSQVFATLSSPNLPPSIMNTVLKSSVVIFTSLSSLNLSPTQQTMVSNLVQHMTQLPPKIMAESFTQLATISRQLPQLSPSLQSMVMDILGSLPLSTSKPIPQLSTILSSVARLSVSLVALSSTPAVLNRLSLILGVIVQQPLSPTQLSSVLQGMASVGEVLTALPPKLQISLLSIFQTAVTTLSPKEFSLVMKSFSTLAAILNPAQMQLLVSFLELIPPKNQLMILMQLAVISEKLGGKAVTDLIGILSQLMKEGPADFKKMMDTIKQFATSHGVSLSEGELEGVMKLMTGKMVLSDTHGMDQEFLMLSKLGLAAQAGAAQQDEERKKINRSHESSARQLRGKLLRKDPIVMALMLLMGGVMHMEDEDFTGGLAAWHQTIERNRQKFRSPSKKGAVD